jgi:hypothetical protein
MFIVYILRKKIYKNTSVVHSYMPKSMDFSKFMQKSEVLRVQFKANGGNPKAGC